MGGHRMKTIDGKSYDQSLEVCRNTCVGCVAEKCGSEMCDRLECDRGNHIFIEVERCE